MTGVVYDPVYLEHVTGPGHPECPERLTAVMRGIEAAVPPERLTRLAARDATPAELARVHTPDYIRWVRQDIMGGAPMLRTGDTPLSARTWDAALRAAGGVLAAVDAVMEGRVANAFCAVRPPGHHAEPGRGMGFCVFNNVALAARHAQAVHGVGRVLVVDWDIHHGNGTQAAFDDDPDVFYFSTHAFPCYPGSGRRHEQGSGAGRGATLNVPLGAGACGRDVVDPLRHALRRRMRTFKPELVLVSAGFDSRIGDPLGHFCLTDDDFAVLTRHVLELAGTYAGGRLVSSLEGGYALAGLASAAGTHVAELASAGA